MKKLLVLSLLFVTGTFALRAQDHSTLENTMKVSLSLPLYPAGAPDSNGLEGKQQWDTTKKNPMLFDVGEAKVYVYKPATDKGAARMAVIICPGGGYRGLSMLSEGDQPGRWFAGRGIVGVVLQYRMPNGHAQIPLEDLHASIRLVRAKAGEWNVDPNKVGVIGFSAGGHLAAMGAVSYDAQTRPDFVTLIYAVTTVSDQTKGSGLGVRLLGDPPAAGASQAEKDRYEASLREYSPQLQVTAQTPPVFIALSDNDQVVPSIHGTLFYNALKAAKVPAELHIWPSGGHGWGWREDFTYRNEFLTAFGRWLDER